MTIEYLEVEHKKGISYIDITIQKDSCKKIKSNNYYYEVNESLPIIIYNKNNFINISYKNKYQKFINYKIKFGSNLERYWCIIKYK